MLKQIPKVVIYAIDPTLPLNGEPVSKVSDVFLFDDSWHGLRTKIGDFVRTASDNLYRFDDQELRDELFKHPFPPIPPITMGGPPRMEFYMESNVDTCRLSMVMCTITYTFNIKLIPKVRELPPLGPQHPQSIASKNPNRETIQVNNDLRNAVFGPTHFKTALCTLINRLDPSQKMPSDELVNKIALFHCSQHSSKLNEMLVANGSFSDYMVHTGIVRAFLEIIVEIVKTTMGPAMSLRTTINSCDRESTIEPYETVVVDTVLL